MKKLILTILIAISCSFSNAQDISCADLFDYVTSQSRYPSTVNCFNSEWLVKVQRYELEGTGFVVAYIKQNDYDYRGKPYIFCGISSYNWSMFRSSGMTGSWGEAFHQYIRDYTCNCY